ncbi:hypothetical protein DACRYDRAFT_23903 [Dacryopinax primogenitus]|uniref:F-box domain-containing protein n=1 Tax=Dacryopinax primogenitus (strain DJM 731) TaxID=1858805 RepID=M5G6E0_DACPD|nr:uncharacterized protein DACRYDRAFT_23903 [Dacryopinax primogenitus]EJT99332.1 hypothetical protein DACRYDRAFT_23903 [Dacryopinax primogenitus]
MLSSPLDRVPNEIWFDIGKLLRRDRPTLLSLSQTCKRLRSLTIPILLYHVDLDLIESPGRAASLLAMLGDESEAGRFVRRMHLRISVLLLPKEIWRLLKVIAVEDLVLSSSIISKTFFDAILAIPSLRSLAIQSCTIFPKDRIHTAVADNRCGGKQLVSLEISWQETSRTPTSAAILSHVNVTNLHKLSLDGAAYNSSAALDSLHIISGTCLTSLRFPLVERASQNGDPYLLLHDTLINQSHIRLLHLHPKVHISSIPPDALPLLEEFKGSCELAEMLVPGRPVTWLSITTTSKFGDQQGDMQETFQAFTKSSRHLLFLEFEEMYVDEEWIVDLPRLFPQLEELRVQSTNYISKGFLGNAMPTHLSKMKACKSIRFRCRGGGSHPLNLLYMPDDANAKWAEQTVLRWGQRNPTLQEVWLGRLSLLKVAPNEWKIYDEFHFRGPAEAYNIPLLLPDRLP